MDTFNFGQIFDYHHATCEGKCAAQTGCVAYTQFATWYPDGEFYASCMGRSDRYDVLEIDVSVLSGVIKSIESSK